MLETTCEHGVSPEMLSSYAFVASDASYEQVGGRSMPVVLASLRSP